MSTTIEVRDIGAVTEFEYTMESYGLHVLRGKAGCGKSTVLRTVQLATDGRTDQTPTKRDGTPRGEATVAGKTVRISKQVRNEGELTVDGLGDLDLTVLHSPKFADAATRDRYRVKALVRLSGVEAKSSLFVPLLGDRESFDEIVGAVETETDDLVEMAARVKKAIEKAALATEGKVETSRANFRAKMDCCDGIDFAAEHDEKKLAAELQAVVAAHSRLQQQRKSALKVLANAAESKKHLTNYVTLTAIHDSKLAFTISTQDRIESEHEVERIERALLNACEKLQTLKAKEGAKELQAKALQKQFDTESAWRSDIEAAESVECPTEDEVATANVDLGIATQNMQSGVRIRDAIASRERASEFMQDANSFNETAIRLRKAASATFDVLSDAISAIPECPLRVLVDNDGNTRLTIETDRNFHEPFDDLSDGERWGVILPMCFARNRLIVLPQAAFGELQPANVALLDALAVEHESYILSAQVDDGELRGERYNGKS